MRGNRRRDTKPELAVRHLLHAAGLRYRVDYPPLPQRRRLRADVVFTRARVAVFIDGCFWHGCPQHLRPARTNAEFWARKIAENQERDARSAWLLREAGWTSLRYWEHDDASEIAASVRSTVLGGRL